MTILLPLIRNKLFHAMSLLHGINLTLDFLSITLVRKNDCCPRGKFPITVH